MKLFKLTSFSGKLVLLATILASGMGFLDGSVVNIAVPAIQKSLGANLSDIQWIINSYTLFLSTLILISGSLGDKFGVKRIFTLGIIVFTTASFLCGISQGILELVIFRSIQGIGAAMMVPGSLSIIMTSFESREHGKVIGLWSGVSGGIAALGPLLGGYLVQVFGWPAIFFINIPLGIVALIITVKFIPLVKFNKEYKMDFLGAIFIFLAFLGITYGLIQQPISGFSDKLVSFSIFSGICLLGFFIVWEKFSKNPLIPFSIFKNSLVTGANLATLFLYGALSAVLFFMVLNFEQIQHFSPLLAGAGLLPTILLITFLSGPLGSLADRIGPRLPMIVGPFLVALGMASFAIWGKNVNYFIAYFPGLVLFGLGMAIVIAPLTKSALAVEHKFSGSASGVNNAVARIAGLLAVVVLGIIVLNIFSSKLDLNISQTSLSASERSQILIQRNDLGGIDLPTSFGPGSRIEAQTAIEDSFMDGFKSAMWICAFLALLSSVISYFTIKNPNN